MKDNRKSTKGLKPSKVEWRDGETKQKCNTKQITGKKKRASDKRLETIHAWHFGRQQIKGLELQ